MKYLKVIWSCLREDDESMIFVITPLIGSAVCVLSSDWLAASAFLAASATGLRRSLDVPEVKLAKLLYKATGDFETVRVERNDSAFPHRFAIYAGKTKSNPEGNNHA